MKVETNVDVSHATVLLESDTVYNMIATDESQAFYSYIYTTHQGIHDDAQYTKGVSIGHMGKLPMQCEKLIKLITHKVIGYIILISNHFKLCLIIASYNFQVGKTGSHMFN